MLTALLDIDEYSTGGFRENLHNFVNYPPKIFCPLL